MLHLSHRRSKDIDIFINYVEMLPLLYPRLNPKADSFACDYAEAENFGKLKLPQGEIDFIVAPHLTSDPCARHLYEAARFYWRRHGR